MLMPWPTSVQPWTYDYQGLGYKVKPSMSHLEQEIMGVGVEESWAKPIFNYSKDGQLPENILEARKMRIQSTKYTLFENNCSSYTRVFKKLS